ncbi:Brix domain-containing protein, partial [Piptocephalis cylindrospora]
MAKRRQKKRTHVPVDQTALAGSNPTSASTQAARAPKSFVIRSGNPGIHVAALVKDVRRVMEPHTATKLKERKSNKLKDFLMVAGQLGVTQFLMFGKTDKGTTMRVARYPRGPTLTFRVMSYSLTKDVLSSQRTPRSPGTEYMSSPLVVLNNFTGDRKELKLTGTMFQNLFPAMDPRTMRLADARRVVLVNYNDQTDSFDFRHYGVNVKPTGVSKGMKKVVSGSHLDLSNMEDVSEFVLREAHASESDVEDGGESTVTLASSYAGRGNRKSEQRAVRLVELGPRMELRLVKVEAGMCDGEVLYHRYQKRSEAEIKAQEKKRAQEALERGKRRKEQEANVDRKVREKEAHRIATGGKPKPEEEEGDEAEKEEDGDEGDEDEDEEAYDEDEELFANESDEEGGEDMLNEDISSEDDDEEEDTP